MNCQPTRKLLLALVLVLCCPALGSADWPHLRGPDYDGTSAEVGLARSWPREGPPRLWTRELGQGHSGFIVAEGRLFTQRQTLSGQTLLCLDPATGQTIWETRYDWAWQPQGAYPGPYASPTWKSGKVYYSSPTGLVGCLDARTGVSLWARNVVKDFQGKGCEFGYAATPLVEEDRVILPVGGPTASLVALHVDDGRTLWTAGSDRASYCPAFPFTFQGRRCVVGYLQNALILVEMATGKLLYRQPLSSGYDEHSAWPLYREPHLVLTSPFRAPASALKLEPAPDQGLVCRPHWLSRELSNDIVSSILYREHIYGFDLKQPQASKHRPSRGSFKCLDWKTGKLCWSTDQVGQASVLAADGKLFLLNDSGTLILARADPTAYHELGRTQLFPDTVCWTPPALWQGRLFVRSPAQAICLHVGSPDQVPGTSTETPTVSRHLWPLDNRCLLTRERDYPNDAPSWEEMWLWFAASLLLVLGGAALVTGLVLLVTQQLLGWSLAGTSLFWGSAFVLALLGPNVLSTAFDRCLFTWPAALYVAFHLTLRTCWWAERRPEQRRARWLARLAVGGLLLVGYGFFELCRAVGLFIAWSFLAGFPLAFPWTVLAVRAEAKQRWGWTVGWTVLGFTAFFWSGLVLLLWKAG